MAKQFKVALDPKVGAYEMVSIGELLEHPENPNQHTEEGINKIADALDAHGWRKPIVVSRLSGFIIKGHGRYRGAVLRDQKLVPVQYQDYETAKDETEDMLADNQVGMETIVESRKQSEALARMKEKGLYTGYREKEVDRALAAMRETVETRSQQQAPPTPRKGFSTERLHFRPNEIVIVQKWLKQQGKGTQPEQMLWGLRALTPQIKTQATTK